MRKIGCAVDVENIKGRQWWTKFLAPSIGTHFFFDYGALNRVQEREKRIVGALFAGSCSAGHR